MLTDRWPMVGRYAELERCRSSLAEDAVPVLVITGGAGVGKTRLMTELCRRLNGQREVLRCVTSPGTAAAPLAAVAHLLPEDAVTADPGVDAAWTFRRVIADFGRRGRPPLLSVDDLHLLDSTSLALVHQLVSLGLVQLIATLRTGVDLPDTADAVRRVAGSREIELAPLGEDEIDTLLHLGLGRPVDAALGQQLWRRSSGNPLILLELVRRAIAQGVVTDTGGVLLATGALPPDRQAADLLRGRVMDCSPAAIDALNLLACAGPLGLELVESMTGAVAVEELEHAALVTIEVSRRRYEVTPTHPILIEVLRERLTVTARRRILRALVERVEAYGAHRRDDGLRLAAWRLDAGLAVDPAALLTAARLARLAHDAEQVERYARLAYDATEPGLPERLRATALLGEALVELARFEEAEQLLQAGWLADAADTDADAIAVIRAANLAEGLLRPADGLAVIRARQARRAEPDPFLDAAHAWHLMVGGEPAAALELLGADDDTHDARTVVARAQVAGPCLAVAGRTEEALAGCLKAGAALGLLHDVAALNHRGLHRVNEALALCEAGRLAEAEACATAVHAEVAAGAAVAPRVWAAITLGRALLLTGRLAAARRWYLEASSVAAARGLYAPRRAALIGLVAATAQLGELEEATEQLSELERLPGPFRFLAPEEALATGWAIAARGAYSEAAAILLDAAGTAEASGHLTSAAWLLHDAVRIWPDAAREAADRLDNLAERTDSRPGVARAGHARALATRRPDALLAAADALRECGLLLAAAEALCSAGAALERDGDRRRGRATRADARRLVDGLQGARTPGLASAVIAVPLTSREREITALAAAGHSTKEIAARLFLSTRTVDNHLQRAYDKLGVNGRQELVALRDDLGQER